MSKTTRALMETAESSVETGSGMIFLGRSRWSLHPKGRAVKAAEPVQAHIPAEYGGQDLLWSANWKTGAVLVAESSHGYISGEGRLPGFSEHCSMIWYTIQEAKRLKLDLAVVWLDLANAYGSVPHW